MTIFNLQAGFFPFIFLFLLSEFISFVNTAATATSPLQTCDDSYFFDTLTWACRSCPSGYTQFKGNFTTCFCNGPLSSTVKRVAGFICDTTTQPLGKFQQSTDISGTITPSTNIQADYDNGKWIKRFTYQGVELNSLVETNPGTGATAKVKSHVPKLYAGDTENSYNIVNSENTSISSQFLIHHLDHALFMLSTYSYPQKLGNICALIKFDTKESLNACSLYKSNISKAPSAVSIFKTTADVNIFDSSCSETVCSSIHGLRIPTKQESSTTLLPYINFKLMVFDLEGNIIDKQDTNGKVMDLENQLFLCPSTDLDGKNMKEFGTDFTIKCSITLNTFISDRSLTKFYSLFVQTSGSQYAEVPIQNASITDTYASRFIILDNISGFEVSTASADPNVINTYLIPEKTPDFITIASSIVMNVKIQSNNLINMPVLSITYTTIKADQIFSGKTYDISFQVKYTSDSSVFSGTAWPIFIVFVVFAGLLWLLRFNIWSKYNPQSRNSSPETFFFLWIVNGIQILIDIWADFSFYFLFFMTGYWFIIYKLQESLYTLMINDTTEPSLFKGFQIFIIIQFVFKLASFLKFIYRQLSADVLFLDWENPKIYDEDSQEEEKKRGISIWRTLFVANEYNELSVTRVTSFEWTLFWVGFFLTGLQWDNLGYEVPFLSVSTRDYVNTNEILRYFIAVLVYIVTVLIQIITKKLFVIWMPTPVQNFTDLCTIANISIFMMDDQLHGYYLHGKAPSGVAEGSTFWLKEAIEKEAIIGNYRGLVKGENIQTFEMYLPIDMRFEFNVEFLQKYEQLRSQFNQNEWILAKTVMKEMLNEMERQQLCQHITNVIKTYIKEIQIHSFNHVLNKSFLHRLIGLPPSDPLQTGLPFFFRDAQMSYSSLFYYGNEWFLIMFEMMTFLFFNYFTDSPLAAIMITFLFNKVFGYIRDVFGRRNISSKTLIDQRFLI